MNITREIETLIDTITGLKQSDSSNKKVYNKVMARLEEAWLWSKEIHSGTCTCPYPDVLDTACPIHGTEIKT